MKVQHVGTGHFGRLVGVSANAKRTSVNDLAHVEWEDGETTWVFYSMLRMAR